MSLLTLPANIELFRRTSGVQSAIDLTLVAPVDKGWEKVTQDEPGADVRVMLFSSARERDLSSKLLADLGITDDDDVSTVEDVVYASDGAIFAIILVYADSDDDNLIVRDYRGALK